MQELQEIHLSPDNAFEALSNSRRRRVILLISRSQEPIPASDLAREIAATENQIGPNQVTGKQRSRVYIALIQSHLDLLDDLGVIEFDDRAKLVAETDNTQPLTNYIELLRRNCNVERGGT